MDTAPLNSVIIVIVQPEVSSMKRIMDFIGSLFLVSTGLILVYLYMCLRSKADNWFASFMMIMFLLGLGIGATVLGCRRIHSSMRKIV